MSRKGIPTQRESRLGLGAELGENEATVTGQGDSLWGLQKVLKVIVANIAQFCDLLKVTELHPLVGSTVR